MARRAAPAGAKPASRVLADLRERVDAGWPAGLTVLTGDDLYHLDQAQRLLLGGLVPEGASEFALTVFGPEKVDVSTVVSAGRSVGMFDDRRVVLVRDGAALEGEPDALQTYAAEPPARSYLIVRAPALDRRRKLHKALANSGQLIELVSPPPDDRHRMAAEVASIAKDKGLELDREAVAFLAEVCGGDLYRVSSELDKVGAWQAGAAGGKADLALVREIAAGGGLLSGWEVANGITLRDAPRALAAARSLVASGDEPLRIVGGLAYRARILLQAKSMLEAGSSFREMTQATRSWGYADDLKRGLQSYTLAELLRFPALLLEADRTLKSRGIQPGAVLENLVRSMTGRSDPSSRDQA